jgi:hypothetical protein
MSKIVKEFIIKEMRLENRDIAIMLPKVVAGYIRNKYKCSAHLAREITKELTHDRK